MKYIYAFIGLSLATALGSWIWLALRARMQLGGRSSQAGGAINGAADSN